MKHALEDVLEKDICIGCGVCENIDDSGYSIKLDQVGKYKAYFQKGVEQRNIKTLQSSCPFSNKAKNETELADMYFDKNLKHNRYIGKYINLYAGYVIEGEFQKSGSSGGIGTWILVELLKKGLVKKVYHVKSISDGDILFGYDSSNTINELLQGAKSKYYPVTLKDVIKKIQDTDEPIAIVGIPCFIKSLRLLGLEDRRIKERVIFTIGLICGHLKSSKYGEMLAWQTGVEPNNIKSIDFREKIKTGHSGIYGFSATDSGGKKHVSLTKDLYGTNWGFGFLKYKACDFCDDIFTETADLVIGDAWIKPYTNSDKGNNIIITRNKILDDIIIQARERGVLSLDIISEDQAIESQRGGMNHKVDGLKYRLYFLNHLSIKKRTKPQKNHVSLLYRIIFRIRFILAKKKS